MKPLEFLFLHKYDFQHDWIFPQLGIGNLIKQMRQKLTIIPLFIMENHPIVPICLWQKYRYIRPGLSSYLKGTLDCFNQWDDNQV